jgi:glyoxylase I family protein
LSHKNRDVAGIRFDERNRPAAAADLGAGFPSICPVAIRMTWTALPMISAGLFWPWGPQGMGVVCLVIAAQEMGGHFMLLELTGMTPLIQVYDMPEAIRFYCDLLGFEVVGSSPEIEAPEGRYFHWAWLRLGKVELMLNTAYDAGERPELRDTARWSGHADTCLFIGCPNVDEAYQYLTSKGLELAPPAVARYGMKQLHLRDPNGYALCFQTPV